jgi:Sporulation and spore germination
MRRHLALAVGAMVLVVATGSCGAGGDDKLRRIDDADLFGLDETTTSTSSTTTTSPPSVQPTLGGTSTTVIPATESVQLYFLDGNRLQPVSIDLAGEASVTRVITALLSGPPAGDLGIGLRTLLPAPDGTDPPVVTSVIPSTAGYATVDLSARTFGLIDPADQRSAIGQIVLTLVSRPGIGQVRFTLDGRPVGVPRKDGLLSEPGEPVSLQDYESLLAGAPTTTTATTAPRSTTTTVKAPPRPTPTTRAPG